MSERTKQSVNDSTGKSRQTVQSYQPVWMAHWMPTSSNAAGERRYPGSRRNEEIDQVSRDDNLTNRLEASMSAKELGPFEIKNFEVVSENHGKAIDYNGTTSRRYLGEGTSKNPLELMKPHSSARETFVGSSSHTVSYYDLENYEFGKGKAAACPMISRPFVASSNQLPKPNLRMLEQEHCYKHSPYADLTCERKMDNHLESDTSMNGRFRKCNTSLLFDAPSTSDCETFGHDWFHKLPNSLHDLKTMRICTTVDSVEALRGGFPRFSQTTHSLLITKKTDLNLPKENDIFRSTRLVSKMNGNTSTDLPSSFFGEDNNRGIRIQPLSSSSNSEGKRNVGNVEASKVIIKNESSAETDTMDMDFFKENLNSGANSSPSTKDFNIHSDLSPRIDVTLSREVGHQWTNARMPDVSVELPALPAVVSPSENACPSSSRTQSLEMDALLAHAEQSKQKSYSSLDDSFKEDPTKRWVKRLKLSSSNSFGHGTNSSNLDENSSHDKMKKLLRGIFENSTTSSEPTPRKHKEAISSGKSGGSSKEKQDFTVDPTKKGKELLLSHPWIKRWLRNGSRAPKKPETVVVCEPRSSKLALDDFQKKQLPSIAAMALMGKAMGGFQSCELNKRGPFTVWKAI